jgi:putative FmdB family regulatory protein
MPIYEYRCEQGHQFEVLQRMSDEPPTTCETCEAPVQQVFHPIAVHFKGSGFYNTDYGTSKRQRELKEAGEGGSSSTEGSSESKSSSESGDAKPSSSESKSDSGTKKTEPAAKKADKPAKAA